MINQTKSIIGRTNYWRSVNSIRSSIKTVYNAAAMTVDSFKEKWYVNKIFQLAILDMCQIDMFRAENECASFVNKLEYEHDRIEKYSEVHLNLFRIYENYVNRLIPMLEGQPINTTYEGEK